MRVQSNQYLNGHGLSRTKFYKKWSSMIQRCHDKKAVGYERYSKVGVCDRWKSFNNFYGDMFTSYDDHVKEFGERETTIERIDNGKSYNPSNCRWATIKEQNSNRSNVKLIDYNGERLHLSELCRKYNVSYETAKWRIRHGWDVERTFGTPIDTSRRRKSDG